MRGLNRILADIIFILLLALLLFFWASPSAMASESEMYMMTEQELVTLENNLMQLEQISQTQKAELTRLKEQLTKSQAELNQLKAQLTTSRGQLTMAQDSLTNANRSLEEFAKEEKRARIRIKAQRNFWETVAIISCTVLATKL